MPINKIKNDTIPDSEITAVKFHQNGATDGQALVWSNANGQWEPGTVSSGGLSHLHEDATPELGGDLDTAGFNITFGNNEKAKFGTGGDMEIYHSGSDSFIDDAGTGSIFIRSGTTYFQNAAGTKTSIQTNAGAGQTLYFNNAPVFATSSTGVELETTEPTITLKRTDNANVPAIKWLGQAGVEGANIKFDGTSGNANQLIFETYDSTTLAERFRITYDGVKITGTIEGASDAEIKTSPIRIHSNTINTNTTVASTENAVSGGPVTIASGVTVTVSGDWTVV